MPSDSLILKVVKVTLIVIAMLVSIVSGRAQGLVSQDGDAISGELNFVTTITYESLSESDTSSQQIEANRGITLFDHTFAPPLPPTPVTDPSSDFQPQVSSLTIQAVPEPSSFALLAVGLLTGATIFRRSRIHA